MIRSRTPALALLLAAVVFAQACASISGQTRLAIASEQLATAISNLQSTEISFHQEGLISNESHRGWQSAFKALAQHILLLNEAIRVSNPEASKSQILSILHILDVLTSTTNIIPLDEDKQIVLRALIESVRSVIVSVSIGVEMN